jgi:hypothetical protein
MGCGLLYQPGPPKKPEPVPVNSLDLLLYAKDLPVLGPGRSWKGWTAETPEDWDWAETVKAVTGWYQEADGIGEPEVKQVILRMPDAIEAARLWEFLRDSVIWSDMNEYVRGEISLLSIEDLPPLHAERVYLICEDYGPRLFPMCAARLQYNMYYVEVSVQMEAGGLTPETFYQVVAGVDKRMRPIWEGWPPRIPSLEIQRWQSLPLGPPGSSQLRVNDSMAELQVSVSITETEQFYLTNLQAEGWTLFEQLRAATNQYGGQSIFLLFSRIILGESVSETVCVAGASDRLRATVAYVALGDCVDVRNIAEDAIRESWQKPSAVAWTTWQDEHLSVAYPATWQQDPAFFDQPYCQPDGQIDCMFSLVHETESIAARFSIAIQARPPNKSLYELALAARDEALQKDNALVALSLMEIRLDGGWEAIQDIALRAASEGDTPGLRLTVHTETESSHIMATGTIYGEPEQMFAMWPLLSAIARSVEPARN